MNRQAIFPFPPVGRADADGLLAMGGSLHPAQVWLAHQSGVFPWYGDDSPILWWAPDPRAVIACTELHISRSLAKRMRRLNYDIRFDSAFTQVIDACAVLHGDTWITAEMRAAYLALHQEGRAHSCELWHDGQLLGGLYGVCLDRVFCGESMFSRIPDASKIVLVHLCRHLAAQDIALLDTQFLTPHLQSMGGREIPRAAYMRHLGGDPDRLRGSWQGSPSLR